MEISIWDRVTGHNLLFYNFSTYSGNAKKKQKKLNVEKGCPDYRISREVKQVSTRYVSEKTGSVHSWGKSSK